MGSPGEVQLRPGRSEDAQAAQAESSERRPRSLTAWRAGCGLLVLQFGVLVGLSVVEWRRYALTYDFAVYAQAWSLLGAGHLYPVPSVFGHAFLANNFELVLWPLGLLHLVSSSMFVLLVVQDLGLVAANLLALRWALEELELRRTGVVDGWCRAPGVAPWLVVLLVLLDPWCYMTGLFDFHAEALAAPFVLLAARSLRRGRDRGALLYALAAAACGVVGALAVAGVGTGALFSRRSSRGGGVVVAVLGLAWVAVVGSAHLSGAAGTDLAAFYGYLLPRGATSPGLGAVVIGALSHLGAVWAVIEPKLATLVIFLVPVGLVGLVDPVACLALGAVALPALASASPATFRLVSAFQLWPALPLVLVASVAAVAGLDAHRRGSAVRLLAGWGLLSVLVLGGMVLDVAPHWIRVSPDQAGTLASIARRLPRRAELIASQGFVGRFADRPLLFTPEGPREGIPVVAPQVVLVLSARAGLEAFQPAITTAFVTRAERRFGFAVARSQDGIVELVWHPPAGVGCIVFPSARVARSCSPARSTAGGQGP
jgi:uncharacterized membrane protein